MNTKFLLLLVLLSTTIGFSQETLTLKNSKPYPATPVLEFICENYALTGTAKIQIAKTEKGGLLKIAVETTNPSFVISGTVYIFFTDNTIITCTDKGNHEIDGNQISSYYSLLPAEMTRLKTTEIQSIHFNIKGKADGFSSQLGNFTAVNKMSYFATAFDKSKKTYDTPLAIQALYKY